MPMGVNSLHGLVNAINSRHHAHTTSAPITDPR